MNRTSKSASNNPSKKVRSVAKSQWSEVYGRFFAPDFIPANEAEAGWIALLSTSGGRRYLTRDRTQKPAALFPKHAKASKRGSRDDYWFSLDPEILAMKADIVAELRRIQDDIEPTVHSGLAGANGVPGPFWSILCASGCGMTPRPTPMLDNSSVVAESGVANAVLARHRPILDEVFSLLLGSRSAVSAHLRRNASTGVPYFVTDPEYKIKTVVNMLKNAPEVLRLAAGGPEDLQLLLNKYHAVYAHAIQERQQPSKVLMDDSGNFSAKPRPAATPEEARSGTSKVSFADMAVYEPLTGAPVKNAFAMRRRDVFSFNGPLNYFLTCVFAGTRDAFLTKYSDTFKKRSREDKRTKASRYKYCVGMDVTTMDKTVPRWFAKEFAAACDRYVMPGIGKVVDRALHASFVSTATSRKVPTDDVPFYGPDPLSGDFDVWQGLPSGVAFNPDFGRIWMVFVYAAMMFDLGVLKGAKDVHDWLGGRLAGAGIDNSADDALIYTDDEEVFRLLQKPQSPYAILDVELPALFLGDVYRSTSHGVDVVANAVTYLVNVLAREDSVDSKPLWRWGAGYIARRETYSSMPLFGVLDNLLETMARKHLGHGLYALAQRAVEGTPVEQVELGYANAMFILDPSVIHFKVDARDVDPALLRAEYTSIPSDMIEEFLGPLFKRPAINAPKAEQ